MVRKVVAALVVVVTCFAGVSDVASAQVDLRLPFFSLRTGQRGPYGRRETQIQSPFVNVYNGQQGTYVQGPFSNVNVPRQQVQYFRLPDGRVITAPVQQQMVPQGQPQYFYGPNGQLYVVPAQQAYGRFQQPGQLQQPGLPPLNQRGQQTTAQKQPGPVANSNGTGQGVSGPLLMAPTGAAKDPNSPTPPAANVASTNSDSGPPLMPIPDTGPEPNNLPELPSLMAPVAPTPVVRTPATRTPEVATREPLRIEMNSNIDLIKDDSTDSDLTVVRSAKGESGIKQVSGELPLLIATAGEDQSDRDDEQDKSLSSFVVPIGRNDSLPTMRILQQGMTGATGKQVIELAPVAHSDVVNHYKPYAGLHVFAIVHPYTQKAFAIQLRLPDGEPKIEATDDKLVFDFNGQRRGIRFTQSGGVIVANEGAR